MALVEKLMCNYTCLFFSPHDFSWWFKQTIPWENRMIVILKFVCLKKKEYVYIYIYKCKSKLKPAFIYIYIFFVDWEQCSKL